METLENIKYVAEIYSHVWKYPSEQVLQNHKFWGS